ncbi:MAG: hypothetical protein B6I32_06380 [Desulfobacterium sp. 4572_20]|nr:MAG: hypothetical protein B6I32_06380 [Desulfobacterium sp. 4572_20]
MSELIDNIEIAIFASEVAPPDPVPVSGLVGQDIMLVIAFARLDMKAENMAHKKGTKKQYLKNFDQ